MIGIESISKEELISEIRKITPKYTMNVTSELVKYCSIMEGDYPEWRGWKLDKLEELRLAQLEKVYNYCFSSHNESQHQHINFQG